MNSYPVGFRVAQVVAITGAGWLGGNIASLSLLTSPALIQARREDNAPSDQVARQWKNLYELGKAQNPPIAAVAASAFFYLAWAVRSGAPLYKQTPISQSALFNTAAAFCLGVVPWTAIAMVSTNNALAAKTNSKPESGPELANLISKWATLNQIRGVFPTIGAVCGLIASLL